MSERIEVLLDRARPVMPVLVIDQLEHAVDLARALHAGGIEVIEVTLRTDCALAAVEAIRRALPELVVGAGTLVQARQFVQARDAGAQFAVSPGFTVGLAEAAEQSGIPYLPGVMTPSEVLQALELGYRSLKLFPANAAGSVKMLESLKGPFSGIRFCPTGGVTAENLLSFLRLPNVACVGGSWLAPQSLVRAGAWDQIRQLAEQARSLAASLGQSA